MKQKITTAKVNKADKRTRIIKMIKQPAISVKKAMKPMTITIHANIIEASSKAPKAPYPCLVHVILVYLKCTPANVIQQIANI